MFTAMERFVDLTARLDAVREVSATLRVRDDHGEAADLAAVLQEIQKTLTAVELVLVRFLALRFTPPRRDADETELVRLQGGEAAVLVGEMRARCHRIGEHYRHGLQGWFADAGIDEAHRTDLDDLFLAFDESDRNVIVPAVDEIVGWLDEEVAAVADLAGQGRYEAAEDHVRAAGAEVADIRQRMGRVGSNLRDLEIQFTPRPRRD